MTTRARCDQLFSSAVLLITVLGRYSFDKGGVKWERGRVELSVTMDMSL